MRFTLAQAAQLVGVEKSTLYKRHRRGELSAFRDESGRFFIDASELFRVYPESAPVAPEPGSVRGNSVEAVRIADLEKLVQVLESERDFLRQQLVDAHTERRRLLEDRTQKPSAPDSSASAEAPQNLLHKLFGRGRG